MLKVQRMFALAAAAGLAGVDCAPRQGAGPSQGYSAYDEVVEVTNRASFTVIVKYYTQGGGPHPLGTVAAFQRETFNLPTLDAGYILVQTEFGRRIHHEHNSNLIEVRRYKVDRATRQEIGSVQRGRRIGVSR